MKYSILRNLQNVQQNWDMDIVINLLWDLEDVKRQVWYLLKWTTNRLKSYIGEIIDNLSDERFNAKDKEDDEDICNLLYWISLIEEEL